MKPTIRMLLLSLALSPLLAPAQVAPTPDPPLPAWEQLTQAQRDTLVAPIRERWNREPGERVRILERARRWAEMPPEQRARARHGMKRWEHMSPQKRAEARALFHAMRGMDEAQRKAFLEQWQQMSPRQRSEWASVHPAPKRQRPLQSERERQP